MDFRNREAGGGQNARNSIRRINCAGILWTKGEEKQRDAGWLEFNFISQRIS